MYVIFLLCVICTGDPNCLTIDPVQWRPLVNNDGNAYKCLDIAEYITVKDLPMQDRLVVWDRLYRSIYRKNNV